MAKTHPTEWAYFGCGDDSGHYLFSPGLSPRRFGGDYQLDQTLSRFDGKLAPIDSKRYVAAYSVLGGIGWTAISWWDNTVDRRPGSNSIIFRKAYTDPYLLLADAQERFPWVFKRLPQAIEFVADNGFWVPGAQPLSGAEPKKGS